MTYMLDTNICVYAIKNKPSYIYDTIELNINKGVCISTITYAELMHGVYKSANIEKNLIQLTKFCSILEILPFCSNSSVEYGKTIAYLQKLGTPIGAMDALIGSHAKSLELTIVTNNMKEFNRIPNLKIENWV